MAGSLDNLKTRFAARFEPDGENYVFRASLAAPGYRVSAAEHDRMVSEYNRRLTWMMWVGPILIVLVNVAIAFVYISQSRDAPNWLIYAVVFLGFAILIPGSLWLWNAPIRELRIRAPDVAARPKPEATRLAYQRLTWGHLGLGVLTIVLMLWRVSAKSNLLAGWNRLWLVLAAVGLVALAVQAVRKLMSR